MPDLNSLYIALRNADKAGDTEGATKLANYIKSMQASPQAASSVPAKPTAPQPPTNPGNLAEGNEYAMGPFGPGLAPTMGAPAARQVGTPQNDAAPYALRNRLSVEVNPSPQQVVNTINQGTGTTSGAIGPQGPQFTAPGQNRPTLVNPPSLPFSHIPTIGGTMDTALSGGGYAVGAGLAGMATANPAVGIAAGSLTAGLGQQISNEGKNLISRFWNKEPLSAEQQKADLESAGTTAAMSAATGSIGLLPSVGNFINRGFLGLGSIKSLQRVLNASTTARNMLDDFYELIGNSKFSPSVTELAPTNVTLAKKFEAASRAGDVNTSVVGGQPILDVEHARQMENVNALANAYNSVTKQYLPNEGYTPSQGSYEAAQAVQAEKGVQQNQIKLAQDQAVNDAKAEATPAISRFLVGKRSTDALALVKQSGQDGVNKAWGDLKVLLGVPPDEAYGGEPFWQPLQNMPRIQFSNTTKNRLTELWSRGMSAMRNTQTGTPEAGGIARSIFDSIPDELYNDPMDPTAGLKFNSTDKELSPNLKWYVDGIKSLRAGIRSSVRQGFNPDTQLQLNVAQILRNNMDDWFSREGDPRILDAMENAEQATKEFHDNFSQGILAQVDAKEAGARETVYNQFASKVLMGGNEDELSRLADVTKQHPAAQNELRLGIWSLIHEGVQDAKNPSQLVSKYNDMKDRLAPAMKYLFSDQDFDRLDSFEKMTSKVDQLNEQYKGFTQDWRNSEWADTPATVSGIRNALYNRNMPIDRAAKLYSFLGQKNPGLLNMVKADMADALAKKVSTATPDGYMPDLTKMSAVLDDKNTQAKVRLFLGGEYLNNASAIRYAGKALRGPSAPTPEAPQSIMTQVVRWLVAPPLSPEGRLYSGILFWRHRAAARAIYNALASPEGLRNFINAAQGRNTRAQVIGTLGALRAGSLASQLPSNPSGQQTNGQSGTQP